MNIAKKKNFTNSRRATRTRSRIKLGKNNIRLSVFRSNKSLYAQLIDDKAGKTLVSASIKDVKADKSEEMSVGIAKAFALGGLIASKAKEKKVDSAVFDRGSYSYHGKVKALADGAREGGLKI